MPTCPNCQHSFTWSETVRRSFKLNSGVKCPSCEQMNYPTKKSRTRSALVSFIPLPIILLSNLFYPLNWTGYAVFLIATFIIVLSLLPFTIRLTDKEEFLW
ncbi:TIGR04104 family putative zinc finger protein [Jeotgalibacillus sp. R-1-5s-1]|uniref:TIGR04104 family putative zinc finger protein n=1 Tax=Jeotgalibacillus sp. R-1-5s-1 TaxID=2555897 RepID=UPI00106A2E8D|nr:hypothetical protein E2491_15345 [Jeotgalibacillus sp. R-1-5s-1]